MSEHLHITIEVGDGAELVSRSRYSFPGTASETGDRVADVERAMNTWRTDSVELKGASIIMSKPTICVKCVHLVPVKEGSRTTLRQCDVGWLNYVTGEKRPARCTDKNLSGECEDFKGKG